jgi:hypothetical protein
VRVPNERDVRALIDQRLEERSQVTSVDEDYGMNEADRYVLADATSAAVTVTLPSAIGLKGRPFTVVRVNAGNTVTVEGDGSETISGAANVSLSSQWESVTVISDNANWVRV